MEYYTQFVQNEIEYYKTLRVAFNATLGYGLEYRSARVWDTLTDVLKGYINQSEYDALYEEWYKTVKEVYANKNLCIC